MLNSIYYIGGVFLQVILFFLPAYLGNAAPVVFHRLHIFKSLWKPLDLGRSWRGKRLLGNNKTFAGVLSAMIGGAIGGLISAILIAWMVFFNDISLDLSWMSLRGVYIEVWIGLGVIFGSWIGLGAIIGDAVKSFFKRRLNIPSGKPWVFFDQIDFIVGAWVFSGVFFPFTATWWFFLGALIITPPLHLLANVIAYKLGWKKVWW
jgi:CDP-2,3-bis-(O-geranylgeranyl)-sn-glycerol synthase